MFAPHESHANNSNECTHTVHIRKRSKSCIINTIKKEEVLKNLPMKVVWTLSSDLNIFLVLPYIFVTSNNKLVNNIIPYICRFLLLPFFELSYN